MGLTVSSGSGSATSAARDQTPTGFDAVRLSDGTSFYLPVRASDLTGLATSAKQDTAQTRLDLLATEAKLEQVRALLAGTLAVGGTVTVSNPTTSPETGLAKDATLTGGSQKSINRGGAKGATTAADVTSTAEGADHQALDVQLYHGGAAKDPTQIRALTSADQVTVANASIPVTGPLTDAQIRASALPISAAALPLPAGAAQEHTTAASPHATRLSDGAAFIDPRQIRALTSADQVTIANGTIAVSGPLTDAQLRASAVPVSAAALPLPTGAAKDTTLTDGTQRVGGTVAISAAALPLPAGAATDRTTAAAPMSVRTSDGTAFIDPRDMTDRAAREAGRVRVWDGVDEATVIPRGGSPVSTDKALAVMPLISGRPVYQLVTPERTMPTLTAAALDYLLTLWHPATLTKDVFILEIGVNIRGVQTAGAFAFELSFMSAENATPGGTAVTPQPLSLANAASGLTVRSAPAAPTLTGQLFQRASFPLPAAATPLVGPGYESLIVYRAHEPDDAIVLRSGFAEGLAVRTNVLTAITTAPIYNCYCRFMERA